MGRGKTRKIKQAAYGECRDCGYKSKGSQGLMLHMKYSHGIIFPTIQKNDKPEIVCGMCKKKKCKINL